MFDSPCSLTTCKISYQIIKILSEQNLPQINNFQNSLDSGIMDIRFRPKLWTRKSNPQNGTWQKSIGLKLGAVHKWRHKRLGGGGVMIWKLQMASKILTYHSQLQMIWEEILTEFPPSVVSSNIYGNPSLENFNICCASMNQIGCIGMPVMCYCNMFVCEKR